MNKADFNVPDLIIKKRNGESLSSAEMDYFVKEVVNGGVQECQLGKTARKLEKIKESFLIKFDSDASVWKCLYMSGRREFLKTYSNICIFHHLLN